MLKKDTILKIEQLLRLKDFGASIANTAEVDVIIPEFTVLEKDELDTRDKNQKQEGIKVGRDLSIKDLKEKVGLTYTDAGSLAPERFIKEYSEKLAKPEGDDKNKKELQTLQEQLDLLKKQMVAKDDEANIAKQKGEEAMFDSELISLFPAKRKGIEKGGLNDGEYLSIIKRTFEFETTENGMNVKRKGSILREAKTQNPLSLQNVVDGFFKERIWIAEDIIPGRAGVSSVVGKSKFNKMSEVIADWEKDGKGTGTAEFQTYIQTLKKEDPTFELKG